MRLHEKLMRRQSFAQYSWFVLFFNLLVIIWGAFVRASNSGDGCGDHWPLCGKHLIPSIQHIATLIEFLHRISTGVATAFLIIMIIWAFLAFPPKHPARLGASLAFLFTFLEAALGAVLVLFNLVDKNTSVARVIAMSAHQGNTLLLLASLALTARWGGSDLFVRYEDRMKLGKRLLIALTATMALAITGAITALADTLYPASSLSSALHQDFSSTAPYLIHLRAFHPPVAVAVMLLVIFTATSVIRERPSPDTIRLARGVIILFLIELTAGVINLLLLAPIWMQGVHLFIADILWVNLVLLSASALTAQYIPQFIRKEEYAPAIR